MAFKNTKIDFPNRFDFFHLGHVESAQKQSVAPTSTSSPFGLLFKITGEETAYCLVSFESMPANSDTESMYTEIANILVSKFLCSMIDETGALLDLSAPEILNPTEKKHRYLLSMLEAQDLRVPAHFYEYISSTQGAQKVPFRLYYLASMKGTS